jgi:1-acyl-sn-glycerol-3-phosphate acyltransferase
VIRTAFGIVVAVVATGICGGSCIVGALLGMDDKVGGVYDVMPRLWGRVINWSVGVKVVVHGAENAQGAEHVFVANHLSWFDITVLLAHLTRGKFVAKAELASIPFFGRAVRSAGMVFIERENRKAAFNAYKEAEDRVHDGAAVVVFAEGTRGADYSLRPFKKGPFVLAIGAQSPIVPTVIYGTHCVQPKGRISTLPGTVHVHFLVPVPTAGLTYEQRDQLAVTVRDRMAALLEAEYEVKSPVIKRRRETD